MFIVCKSLLDNYAGRSEVASFLPALTFRGRGTINIPRLTARGDANRPWVLLNAPCDASCYAGAADFINEANLCGVMFPPVRIPTTFFP